MFQTTLMVPSNFLQSMIYEKWMNHNELKLHKKNTNPNAESFTLNP